MNELEQEVLAELGERQYVEFLADIRKITRLRLKNLGFNKKMKKSLR